MKTLTEQTIYFCDHCGKLYRRKHACVDHEIWCKKNPANDSPCFSCKHMSREKNENGYGEIFLCNVRQEGLCPRWVKNLIPDMSDDYMPEMNQCEHYQYVRPDEMLSVECNQFNL